MEILVKFLTKRIDLAHPVFFDRRLNFSPAQLNASQ